MKRNAILTVILFLAVFGSLFGLYRVKYIPANVYVQTSPGVYGSINCSTHGAVRCSPSSVPSGSHYFFSYIAGVGYIELPGGTPLFLPD